MQSLIKYLKDPFRALGALVRATSCIWPDKVYISLLYRFKLGEKMNWKSPQTYNEKLQWLKLYNRNPLYTEMVDKVKAKEYVASIIGEEYIIPTLGVWNNPYEIDFNALPNRFVLKCNHNSGLGMYICKDKSQMDVVRVLKNLRKGLKQNYYMNHREWPYKSVKRKVFAEKYMEDDGDALTDYKFFCFNGTPQFMYISKDASAYPTTDFFDMNWNHLTIRMKDPNAKLLPEEPVKFEEMKELAKKLSAGIPHVRIDFYVIDNQIYFGEFTFFHNAGYSKIEPKEWNYKIGKWLELPNRE